MTAIINFFKRWLAPVKPAEADDLCPHCHGIGYDASGWTCSCLREKK
jgi:hypothetical protein